MPRRSHRVCVRDAARGLFPVAALLLAAAGCGNSSGPDPRELLGTWDYRAAYVVGADTLVVTGIVEIDQQADTSFGGTFTQLAAPAAVPTDASAPVAGVVTDGVVVLRIEGAEATVLDRGDFDSSVIFGVSWARAITAADSVQGFFTMWWAKDN